MSNPDSIIVVQTKISINPLKKPKIIFSIYLTGCFPWIASIIFVYKGLMFLFHCAKRKPDHLFVVLCLYIRNK